MKFTGVNWRKATPRADISDDCSLVFFTSLTSPRWHWVIPVSQLMFRVRLITINPTKRTVNGFHPPAGYLA